MGAQQSQRHPTVGRTRSLDDAVDQRAQFKNNGRDGVLIRQKSGPSTEEREGKSRSTLVVVNRPSPANDAFPARLEDDPLFKKLEELPMFVPLMHEVDSGSKLFGIRNRALEEIRSRVNAVPLSNIVRSYEGRLKRHAEGVNGEQARLSKSCKEVDHEVNLIFKAFTERQRKFAKIADNFGKVGELAHTLTKCQSMLRDCERNLQILNGFLPIEERLEPFSWSDMFEEDDGNGNNGRGSSDVQLDESVEIAVEP